MLAIGSVKHIQDMFSPKPERKKKKTFALTYKLVTPLSSQELIKSSQSLWKGTTGCPAAREVWGFASGMEVVRNRVLKGRQRAQIHVRAQLQTQRSRNQKGFCPLYPQGALCKEQHSALFIQKPSFQPAPLSYPLSTPKQQGTVGCFSEQHEQETQRCGARFKAQMIQALYFTGGHSLGLYTSFIKLHLNWCSHPDSRNHNAPFPFKKGK